ncbi:MAG: hypothetical protein ACHP65_02285 [Legionellales bacterium]
MSDLIFIDLWRQFKYNKSIKKQFNGRLKMIRILFDRQQVKQSELEAHEYLIRAILEGSCHEVKKLVGWTHFQGNAIYRAKTDIKGRLIYTYVVHEGQKTLMILDVMVDHNYGKLKRQCTASDASQAAAVLELELEAAPMLANRKDHQELAFLPTISYKDKILILDASQHEALSCLTPLLLVGPPGAGKTALLYHIMLQNLDRAEAVASAQAASSAGTGKVLFVGPQRLLSQLKAQHEVMPQHPNTTIEFTTWNSLLELHYQGSRKEVSYELFGEWLADKKVEGDAKILHYEFSLIAALGAEKYLALGQRQCYYFGAKAQQQRLIRLVNAWQNHLEREHLFDPMVTALNTASAQNYSAIYCDETQNLPPIALAALMTQVEGRHFIACLDSEQCLFSSPYVHNCLKELFHQRYQSYTEHPLPKTWRCPPEVIAVANHLLDAKYKLDGRSAKRRPYKATVSTQPAGGESGWLDKEQLRHIKHYGALSGTVVIAEHFIESERRLINEQLGSNNILTAAEVIGLDFDTVILWNPFAQKRHFQQLSTKDSAKELSIDQWNALNALYVAITRAQKNLFIYDSERKRFKALSEQLFGVLPPLQLLSDNQADTPLLKQKRQAERQGFQEQVSYHLSEGNTQAARQLMSFHLQMGEEAINATIKGYVPLDAVLGTATAVGTRKKHSSAITALKETAASSKPQAAQATVADTQKKPSPVGAAPKEKKTAAYFSAVAELKKYLLNLSSGSYGEHSRFKARLQQNPDLAEGVSIDDLCRLRLRVAGEDSNTSALYCLAGSEDGCSILTILFEKNPNLAAKISAEALCYPYSSAWAKDSALLRLTVSGAGQKLLHIFIKQNSELAAGISGKSLGLTCPEDAGAVGNTSALYWLAIGSIGRSILTILLQKNSALATGIKAKDLCRTRSKTAGAYANTSALYYLASHSDGMAILKCLLEKNSTLASKISAEALCCARPKESRAGATSVLYWLTSQSEGRVVLKLLLECDPALASKISTKALCRALPKAAEADANTSALSCLTGSPEGLVILKCLLEKNPVLATEISAEALCLELPVEAGVDANTSALYWLTRSPEGLAILKLLLEKNPDLAVGISAEALCRTLPDEAGEGDANVSALHWLASPPGGVVILKLLLEKNPNLADGISAEALCCALPGTAGENAYVSVLYCLACSPEGVAILELLLKKNPDLATKISAEALCRTRPEAAGAYANTSAWSLLAGSSDGLGIRNIFLQQNQALATAINSQALCCARPAVVAEEANVLVLLAPPGSTDRFFSSAPSAAAPATQAGSCTP